MKETGIKITTRLRVVASDGQTDLGRGLARGLERGHLLFLDEAENILEDDDRRHR